MFHLRHNRFKKSHLGIVYMAMVVLLCLCIVVQMLGVPVTLLNLEAAADTLTVSASEGFSVPSSFPELTPSVEMVPVSDAPSSAHVPVLASVLFHPPVL
jgi:hypothetical protein